MAVKKVQDKKTKKTGGSIAKFDQTLLKILACPVAVHLKDKGKDPGKLRLYKECWLISDVSGYKYPIVDGVPIMLVDEGKKWAKTSEGKLPVPPPKPKY